MKIIKRRQIAIHALLLSTLITGDVFSAETDNTNELVFSFNVSPQKCIALHRNQICYQKLKFTWYIDNEGDYCLYQISKPEALVCWHGKGSGELKYEFQSDQSETYQIREETKIEDIVSNKNTEFNTKVLGGIKVKLATVYKQTKQSYSGWRIF